MKNFKKIIFWSRFCLMTGITLILLSIGMYFYSYSFIDNKIKQRFILSNGTDSFESWKNPPAVMYRKIYFFNIKNLEEVEKGEQKAFLEQKGPYVFREIVEKNNIRFNDNGTTLTYNPVLNFQFMSNMSVGSLNDQITTLNIPAFGIVQKLSYSNLGFIDKNILKSLLFNAKLFQVKSVDQMIHGYSDTITKFLSLKSPVQFKDGKFSLFGGKLNTEWQNLTIMTGVDNYLNAGKIIKWNGLKKLKTWNDDYANSINGSDGLFPPFISRNQTVYIFNSDICRSLKLKYSNDEKIKGTTTFKFELEKNIFDVPEKNPENFGFSSPPSIGNGVFDLTKCNGELTSYLSRPHFLFADKKFTNEVDGLSADKEKHDFNIKLEPTTGVPLEGFFRLQLNFNIKNNSDVTLVKNVKNFLLPVMWFEKTPVFPDESRGKIAKLNLLLKLTIVLPVEMFSIGVLFLFLALFLSAFVCYKRNKSNRYCDEKITTMEYPINQDLLL